MNEGWIMLISMVMFLLGFWIGRRVGLDEGFHKGLKQAPLEIKRRSLEEGECVICGITKNFQDCAGKL
ncbi:hypothetical protein BBF96_04925 [Anoxybacter fermentans]|uniref:Uncharacterized protein n=1 Tax=Anoxybacter fermentans TaxID=1323375 RepID=A0A3Q9HPS6_9FIRM|nr:hypothetical protein [Anoxybacter fermentans]AZR72794.1 hypothetical protein BBF96_04925 [Anoxybacter fermentans]